MPTTQTIESFSPPFGMVMPGRNWTAGSATGYGFGFNGKLKDDDISGNGNIYDYEFRIYNPSIGKFLSVDPLSSSYPYYSPYQFAGNKPIKCIDLDGLEDVVPGSAVSTTPITRITTTTDGFVINKTWTVTSVLKDGGYLIENYNSTLQATETVITGNTLIKSKTITIPEGGKMTSTLEVGDEVITTLPDKNESHSLNVNTEIELTFQPYRAKMNGSDLETAMDRLSEHNKLLIDFPEIEAEITGYTGHDWEAGEEKTYTPLSSKQLATARATYVKTTILNAPDDQVTAQPYKDEENKNKIAASIKLKLKS